MNKLEPTDVIAMVVLAVLGLGFVYLLFKGVGLIVSHPFISLLAALAIAVAGSRFLATKK
jgi:hypothetical protein